VQKRRFVFAKGVHFKKGHTPLNTLITKEEAEELRQIILSKQFKTLKQMSVEMDISYQMLRDINCGRTYK